MKQIRLLLTAMLAATSLYVKAGEITEYRHCAKSSDERMTLELRTYSNESIDWIGGFVRYKGSSSHINLGYNGTKEVQRIPDTPSEFEYSYLEIVNGQVTGEYRYRSQGANVYNLSYYKYSNKRTYRFPNFDRLYGEEKCF